MTYKNRINVFINELNVLGVNITFESKKIAFNIEKYTFKNEEYTFSMIDKELNYYINSYGFTKIINMIIENLY